MLQHVQTEKHWTVNENNNQEEQGKRKHTFPWRKQEWDEESGSLNQVKCGSNCTEWIKSSHWSSHWLGFGVLIKADTVWWRLFKHRQWCNHHWRPITSGNSARQPGFSFFLNWFEFGLGYSSKGICLFLYSSIFIIYLYQFLSISITL